MKPLLIMLMVGGLAPATALAPTGPTPPPGPPLPGPPPILEPFGPSTTLPGITAAPTGPATIPPVATPLEPSGRPMSSAPATPTAGSAEASTPAGGGASASPAPETKPETKKSSSGALWITIGVVSALVAAAVWFVVRRRRHAQ